MNKLLKSVNRDQKYRKNNKWHSYLFIKLFSSFFFKFTLHHMHWKQESEADACGLTMVARHKQLAR